MLEVTILLINLLYGVESASVSCYELLECANEDFNDTSLTCLGLGSCFNIDSDLIVPAASGSNNNPTMQCRGGASCCESTVTIREASCYGEWSCNGMKLRNHYAIDVQMICEGSQSCMNLEGPVLELICEGYQSCKNSNVTLIGKDIQSQSIVVEGFRGIENSVINSPGIVIANSQNLICYDICFVLFFFVV